MYPAPMGVVHEIIFYMGKSPAAKHAKPAQNLKLEDKGHYCQMFHRALLKSQAQFNADVKIPELLPVKVDWTGIGQTAGMAIWHRDGKIGTASILLNGVEADQEVQAIETHMRKHRLPLPKNLWRQAAREGRPILISLHYDLRSFTDPVIVTAAAALANAFFAMFGTNER